MTGVVDWDHPGLGSRALDLTSLLLDWRRLRLAREGPAVSDWGERLVRRIAAIARRGRPALSSRLCRDRPGSR
jgi:aminoglycoside phosphotransferase (APT) family kinase protein